MGPAMTSTSHTRSTRFPSLKGMLLAWTACCGLPGISLSGPNPDATLVLHAVPGTSLRCDIEDPCLAAGGPTVSIANAGAMHTIYLLVRHYDNFACFQCAFDWSPGWTFSFHLEECLPGQLGSHGPVSPGPIGGSSWGCANCVTSGTFAILTRLYMTPTSGCLEVIESGFSGGTHITSCNLEIDRIGKANRGRVCVGQGGFAPCDPVVPVESTTWGSIKAQYR
jgi:hypothetical protein